MGKKIFENYHTTNQECYEYDPIQNTKNPAFTFDGIEMDDEGCDTCIHCNNQACDVFKKEN